MKRSKLLNESLSIDQFEMLKRRGRQDLIDKAVLDNSNLIEYVNFLSDLKENPNPIPQKIMDRLWSYILTLNNKWEALLTLSYAITHNIYCGVDQEENFKKYIISTGNNNLIRSKAADYKSAYFIHNQIDPAKPLNIPQIIRRYADEYDPEQHDDYLDQYLHLESLSNNQIEMLSRHGRDDLIIKTLEKAKAEKDGETLVNYFSGPYADLKLLKSDTELFIIANEHNSKVADRNGFQNNFPSVMAFNLLLQNLKIPEIILKYVCSGNGLSKFLYDLADYKISLECPEYIMDYLISRAQSKLTSLTGTFAIAKDSIYNILTWIYHCGRRNDKVPQKIIDFVKTYVNKYWEYDPEDLIQKYEAGNITENDMVHKLYKKYDSIIDDSKTPDLVKESNQNITENQIEMLIRHNRYDLINKLDSSLYYQYIKYLLTRNIPIGENEIERMKKDNHVLNCYFMTLLFNGIKVPTEIIDLVLNRSTKRLVELIYSIFTIAHLSVSMNSSRFPDLGIFGQRGVEIGDSYTVISRFVPHEIIDRIINDPEGIAEVERLCEKFNNFYKALPKSISEKLNKHYE